MWSSTKSGLQRSRSSSSIPQPLRLSRLPVRNSIQKNRGKSLSRQDKLSLDRNMTRPSSNSSELPRLSRQRSSSLVRQTLNVNTPLGSCRSGRKSPLMSSVRKDTRPITDKRWQYEQIVKVRNFVAAELSHLDHNNIKSGIPLELFVALMDSYFKLIDKRITITRENYLEEVPTNLKRYRYPTSVKPSLMKTVNTPHSWPHVVAILSWLTDIIYEINGPAITTSELGTFAEKCVTELWEQWNKVQDNTTEIEFPLHELDLKLDAFLKFDDEENNKLDKALENLRKETALTQKKKDIMEKIEALRQNTKSTNEKCDFYKTEKEKLENQMKEQHTKYAMKIKKIDEELTVLVKTEDQLKAVITSQPHSFVEKQQLSQEIKDLQNTLKLKEERHEQQRELVNTYDFKLSDLKQQMEANAYKYNNIVNQLELSNPEFRDLHIRESGFARKDTEDEIKEALRLLKETITKLQEKLEVSNRKVEEVAQKQKQIDEELVIVKEAEKNLSKLEAELNITLKHQKRNDDHEKEKASAEINKYQNKILELKNSRYDITPLEEEYKQLEKTKEEHLAFKQDLLDRALDFFLKLEVRMSNNLQMYMNVMEEITAVMISAQENAISESKHRIEKFKQARDE